ncbi:MAG: EAL domain-containing protein [Pseudoflavonifractor sp.]|nr:EAL domain-containing protein [Pseudoflavonifractor sp.]
MQGKDILYGIVIFAIIPVILLKYVRSASVTIWAFPLILLFISLVFSSGFIRIALSISIILSQILVWVITPEATITVSNVDYLFRLVICAIAMGFAFVVHKAYISKLTENAEQIKTQRFVAEVSTDFLSVNENGFETKAYDTLNKIVVFFDVDRANYFLFDSNHKKMTCIQQFASEWIKPELKIPDEIDCVMFPWLTNQILSNQIIIADDTDYLPKNIGQAEQCFFKQTMSLIAFPIVNNETVMGFISIDSMRLKKKWSENQISCLKIITNIFAETLVKVNQEKRIEYMAYYDYLTNLPNRLLFKDRLSQAIHQASHTSMLVAVIFLDLDSFKTVNDTVGHEGGDELLIKVAHNLLRNVRSSDTVSRFGGDEFLIMLNNIGSVQDIVSITEKIMSLFHHPYIIGEHEFFVTASAGIAVYPTDGTNAEKLIKNADIAMYKAKEQGKSQYLLCTTGMKDEILLKIKLIRSLYRALDKDELVLYYQPQVCTETKKIIGLEALIRWNHPEMGMLAPGLFMNLAEQTGLIVPIGEWALKTACIQLKKWLDAGFRPIRMAINVSIIQFRNPNFVSQIHDILRDTETNPENIELEITESIAIHESEYIVHVLNDLKKLGVSISIDDFGTEYSSLSRLTILPIDRLKMDIQFIRGIDAGNKERAIVTSIINLAQNLGLKVIAEGVENRLQFDFLAQKQCDEIQGFYFYRPGSAKDIESLLSKEVVIH